MKSLLTRYNANSYEGVNAYLIGMILHNIGVIKVLKSEGEESISYFQQAIRIKMSALGKMHVSVADSLNELGIQYFAQEQFEKALAIFSEALTIRKRGFGPNHPKTGIVVNNIACIRFLTKDKFLALNLFQDACDTQRLALGSSASVKLHLLHKATSLSNLAYIELQLKNYDEAATIFEEALLVQQSVLEDGDNTIRNTQNNLLLTNAFHS
mmetsp:Transcript_1934/g.2781  ORF Transcript_1934/g.2781 Transcript_1934/m.2781 type:complete len:211 (-) Transcript_1934:197-829(-)